VSGFDDFYRGSYRQLFRVLVTFTTDPQDAEDVLQEAYAKAAASWPRVSQLDNPGAWVRRVALNRAVDLHRRHSRRRDAYQRLEPRATASDAVSLDVEEGLRALRAEDRQVVVLHHLVGLTVTEIAGEVGRPTGTVKSQLVRGRRELASHLRLAVEEVT
jgi:RNA polymerase sigma-70 factor (ECF subfamily)